MNLITYLVFQGKCDEAFKFYEKVLRGKIESRMTFGESPMAAEMPQEIHDQIMHVTLAADGFQLMGSDSACTASKEMGGFALSLHPSDLTEAERLFTELSDGGAVQMALEETFWAERFGMCTDRFGTPWMINVVKETQAA